MILELVLVALTAAEAGSGVTLKTTSNVRSIPYLQAYVSCFERAAVETMSASRVETARRMQLCRSTGAQLVSQHNALTPSVGLQAKRQLEQSFNQIEKAYADALAKRAN